MRWHAVKTIKGWYVRRINGTLGEAAIAKVLRAPGAGSWFAREQETEANAHLLAAAPEMRELLWAWVQKQPVAERTRALLTRIHTGGDIT